jgi:N-acetyltransferase
MDSNDEKETPQSLLDRHEDECTDNDDGGGRYHLQCQNKAVTTTPTPSVSRFDKKEKKSSTASTTLSVTSSLTLTSNKANKRSMYSNNIIKQSLKSSSVTSQPIQRKTKKKKTSSRQQQLFLDFGQTSFGKRTVCNICGMLRVLGVAEDDAQHDKICKDYKEGVTCLGWKNERIMEEFGGKTGSDRILEVREGDALQHRRKVLDVKRIVDSELGFAVSSGGRGHDDGLADNNEVAKEDSLNGLTSYLYVSNKRIVGLLLVKRIQRAYQVVVPNFKTNNNKNIKNNHDESSSLSFSISRSLKSSRALLGIHQIWVHSSHRNKGIASKLVTAARDHLIFGMMIPLELIAFSSPTMEGLRFAKSYVGVERPLVYDIN